MASKCTVANERGSQEYTNLLRTEVESTIGIMEQNAKNFEKRGGKLGLGEIQIIKIEEDAKRFKDLARENKNKQMWKNYRMIIIGCTVIAVLSLLVLIVLFFFNDSKD